MCGDLIVSVVTHLLALLAGIGCYAVWMAVREAKGAG